MVIFALTKYDTDGIGGSIIHTIVSINTYHNTSFVNKTNIKESEWSILIIDEVSMINFMLTSINK